MGPYCELFHFINSLLDSQSSLDDFNSAASQPHYASMNLDAQ
jgi:hypothetical protein